MNPILPRDIYIPDGEARVWSDGRLYLYGSRDEGGANSWCSDRYHVFSTDDLRTWTDHGVSFHHDAIPPAFGTLRPLAAPDCVCKDGLYYLYFCMNGLGGREGVAVSSSPAGPFREATRLEGVGQIDPAALVDDDGRAYLFWGQVELKGAELNSNMRSIKQETLNPRILTDREHGFHEGASIRKVRGLYYMVYADVSRGRPTCLAYATAEQPLGPYTKRGILIDNIHCDGMSWNNHGSIFEFQGRHYVMYHRCSLGTRFSRRACLEPIHIQPDGSIAEVPMTTHGAGPLLDPMVPTEAWRACFLYGRLHTHIESGAPDGEILAGSEPGDQASFKTFDFRGQTRLTATVRGAGEIIFRIGDPFLSPAHTLKVTQCDSWQTLDVEVPPLHGSADVHVLFQSRGLALKSFQFS